MSKTVRQTTAETWIAELNLHPHPEGGWYRESYRAAMRLEPEGYGAQRAASTAIYYLLQSPGFSAFHRLRSDEVWHFYDGDPVLIYEFSALGLKTTRLGRDPYTGCALQHTVPGNTWFAAEPQKKNSYALVGCTVAPGFDFLDFELADAGHLRKEYPQHSLLITRLCTG